MTTTNGRIPKQPPTPAEIKEQRKQLRARIRLAQDKQLLESLWPWDDFGGNDLWDRARPSQNDDGGDRYVPISYPTDRRHGANWPLWRTQQELDWLRQESRIRAATNSYAIGLLKNLTNNVIGKGCSYKVQVLGDDGKPAAETDLTEQGKSLVRRVQKVVDEFLRLNHWNGTIDPKDVTALAATREREIYRTVYIDGECFLRFHRQGNGTLLVRVIDASRIRDGGAGLLPQDGWTYGIQHQMDPFEDMETPLAYSVYWPDPSGKGGEGDSLDDQGSWQEIDAKYVLHLKGPDTPSEVKRGLPYFIYDVGKALDRAARLQRNASTGAGVRAAVAWTEQWDQATQAQVQSLADSLATRQTTDPLTGERITEERIRPGTIRRVPVGWKRGEESADNTPSYLQAVQGDLQEGGAASCAPAYWFGDTGDVNYNNAESAAAPAVRSGQCEQEYYKIAFGRAVWKAVEWAAECGELPEDVADKVTITVEFPAVLHRNELEKAQEDQIGVQTGWKDRQTCAAERGLDWKTVEANNADYAENQMDMMPQLPMPGEGGGSTGTGVPVGGGGMKPKKPPMPKPAGPGETRESLESKDASGHEHDPHSGQFTGATSAMKAAHPYPAPFAGDIPHLPPHAKPEEAEKDPAYQAARKQWSEHTASYHRAYTADLAHRLLSAKPPRLPPPDPTAPRERRVGLAKRAVERVDELKGDVDALGPAYASHHAAVAASHPQGKEALDAARKEAQRRYDEAVAVAKAHVAALPEDQKGKAGKALEKAM